MSWAYRSRPAALGTNRTEGRVVRQRAGSPARSVRRSERRIGPPRCTTGREIRARRRFVSGRPSGSGAQVAHAEVGEPGAAARCRHSEHDELGAE